MGIFSLIFLVGFVSTSLGNFCSKRFSNGKWISHGDCGETPNGASITNDLAKVVSCQAVPPSEGLIIGCSGIKYGDTCKFACKSGFHMNGVGGPITCGREGATGKWSGAIPTCRTVSCQAIPSSEGLIIGCSGIKYGDTCTFGCQSRFNMNGVGGPVTCGQEGATGKWSGAIPRCRSKRSVCEAQSGLFISPKCFTIVSLSSKWQWNYDDAVRECYRHGALLAEIHNRAEQNALIRFARSKIPAGVTYVTIWIAMEYNSVTKSLQFRSGKRISYSILDWAPKTPPDDRFKYIFMGVQSDKSFLFTTEKASRGWGMLCEKVV